MSQTLFSFNIEMLTAILLCNSLVAVKIIHDVIGISNIIEVLNKFYLLDKQIIL